MENIEITQIFTTGKNTSWFDECKILLAEIQADFDEELLQLVYKDVHDIFHGNYHGFATSKAKYHDFCHTCSTTLAVARLFHGLSLDGWDISSTTVEQGIFSALFHDIGWLPSDDEELGLKRLSTENHEERSISFLSNYLKEKGFSTSYRNTCAEIIRCTNLNVDPDTLDFNNESEGLGGYVVGSADIMSQMSDRCYLERLPFLFREQGYAKLFVYKTPSELLQKTAEFYSITVTKRLEVSFHNVYRSMRSHFRERWQLDRDLYSENIIKNIEYLKKVTQDCDDEFQCIEKHLRRNISAI